MSAEWVRLGEAVRAARNKAGLTQQQVRDLGGPAISTLSRLENGEATVLTRGVRRALERALGWPENQIDAILQGKRRAPAPRRSSVTGHRIFTTDTVGRWQQALIAIAEPGCLQMARTCCCHVRHLPHLDWCAPCVAHNALNPHARDIEVQR